MALNSMSLYLYNTLGKSKQEFIPIDKNVVRMYSCGPTVYNYAHIGNLRAYIFVDILKRTLKYNGYNIKHIMNVTDVGHLSGDDADDSGDDKMVKALKREGKEMTLENMRSIADFYFVKFKEDLIELNVLLPDEFPFASDHIKESTSIIQILLDKGFAYTTENGIYYDTEKAGDYGKLGGISNDSLHSRIGINNEKKNYRDFALWKFTTIDGIGFDAPFGKGFPGWHIECSAMSQKYLGVTFDIHTGGIDHIPVHHNNEIAQTEKAFDKKMANFWIHNAHVTIGEDKMAKSGDNFVTLNTLKENGVHALAYRYWLLTSKYSTRVDYTIEAIKAAQTAYEKLHDRFNKLKTNNTEGSVDNYYKNKFTEAINNDLDTPSAVAITWELVKDENIKDSDKKATLLDFDAILGLTLGSVIEKELVVPEEIQKILYKREQARNAKNWQESDEIRIQINKLGFDVKDTPDGQILTNL